MLHGGEIYKSTEVRYDFSVNINPLGIPEGVLIRLRDSLPFLEQYPDRDCTELRRALEKFTGIPMDRILCGNGASELIEASVRGLGARSILLTAPSFSGYLHAAEAAGAQVRYHMLKRAEDFALTDRYLEDLAEGPDLAILCSPANPVGNLIDPGLLVRIAEICRRQGTWLLIDECFLGFLKDERQRTLRRLLLPESSSGREAGGSEENVEEPAEETADSFREKTTGRRAGSAGKKTDRAGNQKLLVLDAFTKRFAMPGIRLGYLMAADPSVLEAIHAQQAEWSVSLPAQIAGTAALEAEYEDYLQRARTLIARERKKMETALRSMGCRVFPGEANYIFFSCGTELFLPLLSRGILIRQCDNYKGLQKGDYRVAVRLPEENDILLQAMAEILRAGRGASRIDRNDFQAVKGPAEE